MITNLWNELKNQALKFKNRDFLDASLAGAALGVPILTRRKRTLRDF